jgi:hypothetical protein
LSLAARIVSKLTLVMVMVMVMVHDYWNPSKLKTPAA